MSASLLKMTPIQITVSERAKETLARQAQARGLSMTKWANHLFDAAFLSACAREKSMPGTDADLDAIVGATLLLRAREKWDTATIARSLGVSEPTIVRILDAWREYRAGEEGRQPERKAVGAPARTPKAPPPGAELLKVRMRRHWRMFIELLLKTPDAFVPMDRITAHIWADDPHGGPDDAEGIIHTHVTNLRKFLKPHGWTVESSRGEGYRLKRLSA